LERYTSGTQLLVDAFLEAHFVPSFGLVYASLDHLWTEDDYDCGYGFDLEEETYLQAACCPHHSSSVVVVRGYRRKGAVVYGTRRATASLDDLQNVVDCLSGRNH
jgi:hypothetical protein